MSLIQRQAITKRLVQTAIINPLEPVVIPAASLISIRSYRVQGIERSRLRQSFDKTSRTRQFHSLPVTMANQSELKQTLTPALLDDVHTFWFDHLESKDALILPKMSDMGRWFSRDPEFDKACV
jgi:hypothetical protein